MVGSMVESGDSMVDEADLYGRWRWVALMVDGNGGSMTKPEVVRLAVLSKIMSRFASTEVRSKLKNLNWKAAEAKFTISLPEDAFISAFSITKNHFCSFHGQTKRAFTTILDDVRPIDRINIVLFESDVRVWRGNQMVEDTSDNIAAAKRHVNRIRAGGGTNLYDGLRNAVDLLMEHGNGEAMPLIIMLTDGQPTSGSVKSTSEIIQRITNLIDGRLSLFSVSFGNGVDFSFLEKLSLSNQALARKVYEDSSASLQMKGFYDEVANPLLFNINLEYSHGLVDEDSLTQSNFMAYFDGTEITVAGKLKDDVIYAVWNSSNETILPTAQHPGTISIGDGNEGGSYVYGDLSVFITGQSLDVDIMFNTSTPIEREHPLRRHEVDDFAQRLWAYLTIKKLLDQRKTVDDRETKAALSERTINLSLKYHFVTPLTSLLVVKPDVSDTDIHGDGELEVLSADTQSQSSSNIALQSVPRPRPKGTSGVSLRTRPPFIPPLSRQSIPQSVPNPAPVKSPSSDLQIIQSILQSIQKSYPSGAVDVPSFDLSQNIQSIGQSMHKSDPSLAVDMTYLSDILIIQSIGQSMHKSDPSPAVDVTSLGE
eukprot:XP_011679681.1 PREDICTED: inter-alpha-trypsin inhibitor heavy chain H3 [Strongylocentrotus purpuratus]